MLDIPALPAAPYMGRLGELPLTAGPPRYGEWRQAPRTAALIALSAAWVSDSGEGVGAWVAGKGGE